MKKFIFLGAIILAAGLFIAQTTDISDKKVSNTDTLTVIKPAKYYSTVDEWISTILSRYHYRKIPLNDSLSSVIFDRYLKTLDYNKAYFLQSDINNFDKYRFKLDDDIKDGDVQPAYDIFNKFKQRLIERTNYVNKLLDKKFDFTKDEKYQIKRENEPWAKNEDELNEIWRKKIKNDALTSILTGKDWKTTSSNLKKRYDNFQKNVIQYKSEDVFQLLMNSYTEALDPHTNYLSPISSDNFKIDMSLSLEGIGAQLQQDDDYTKVNEIIPGGPAFKSKLLHRDDRIIGVAQGNEGEMVDVIGWRITDVVQLIRGPKGSTVRLQILEAEDGANALPKEIKIVRDKVKLEEQSAKSDVIDIKNNNQNYKLGVISIPKFYVDFDAEQKGVKDFKSTTRDVKRLITELEKKKVDGIIIDLRNNGGGALNEAIDLTGLFIKDGPVVQVRSADGKVDVGDDPDPNIVYDGPLAVLVNRFSASASEIFTGAIQDYGRGIIIGEQTYGKGTVQNLIDLNRVIPNQREKLGQLKLTIAKYYRINGGSTQNKGVIPDIQFPSAFDSKDFGESSEPSALPWDQIQPTAYKKFSNLSDIIPMLLKKHIQRFDKSPEYDYLMEDIDEFKEAQNKKYVSLNEEVRKKEKDELEEKRFQRENERRKLQGLTLLKKGEKPAADTSKDDPILDETGQILSDLIQSTVG